MCKDIDRQNKAGGKGQGGASGNNAGMEQAAPLPPEQENMRKSGIFGPLIDDTIVVHHDMKSDDEEVSISSNISYDYSHS